MEFRCEENYLRQEGGFVKMTGELERLGIIVESGAGLSHPSGKIDRRIRSIKESVRCILISLPFNLPLSLLKYAVMFAVSRFNLFRHSQGWADGASPRELVTGGKRITVVTVEQSLVNFV